jgi:DNA-binding NarL/FixJ family response regulator
MRARLVPLGIAGLTALANVLLGVRWVLALTAGVGVIVVWELVGRVVRSRPQPEAPQLSDEHPLSPREVQVGVLIAKGLTSKEAGRKLFIEKATVDTHVQHIYNKLDIDSRAQLAVWLVEHGLFPKEEDPDLNTNKHK